MKKFLAVVTILVLSVSLFACGESANSTNYEPSDDMDSTLTLPDDEKEITEIVISLENFNDYFEFSTDPEPKYNDFNEVEAYDCNACIVLKDEYIDKFVTSKESKVAIEFNFRQTSQTYKITDAKTGAYEFTGEQLIMGEFWSDTLYWNSPEDFNSIGFGTTFYNNEPSLCGMTDIEITRAEGTLYLCLDSSEILNDSQEAGVDDDESSQEEETYLLAQEAMNNNQYR